MSGFIKGFIVGSLYSVIGSLLCEPVRRKWRKECNYDCSKCRVWDCPRHTCLKCKEKSKRKGE